MGKILPLPENGQWPAASSYFILADENTAANCLPRIKQQLPEGCHLYTVPPGEAYKNLDTCQKVWANLAENGADRQSLLICLGGGTITDMGGFCASVYMRGIRFVHIPTTLLAMVDAAIGGKTGVDFAGKKNYIGTFTLPQAIYINIQFLQTLPRQEIESGFAEVFKHALVAGQQDFENLPHGLQFNIIENHQDLILHSAQIKQFIVNEDPEEKGVRQVLNLGHTVGHALESYFLNLDQPKAHGICVAAGLWIEAEVAFLSGIMSLEWCGIIQSRIEAAFNLIPIKGLAIPQILTNALQDKKNVNGQIYMPLMQIPGRYFLNQKVSEKTLLAALKTYQEKFPE